MFDVKRMLRLTGVDSAVEISTAEDGVSENVTISEIKDQEYVTKVMEAAGFHQTKKCAETAAFGTLEFTNIPLFSEYDDLETSNFGDENESDGDEIEISFVEESGHGTDDSELAKSDVVSIDGDGRSFAILVDGETHKFANKIYTQMLNNEDMSRYGAFMYDLDNFLRMYKGEEVEEEDEEDEDDSLEGSVPTSEATESASFEDVNLFEVYPLTVAEMAHIIFNTEANTFYETFKDYLPEKANKAVVNIILGIVLKIIVGALGKALLTAWARRDKGMFESLLHKLVVYIVNDYFPMGDGETETYERYYDDYRQSAYGGSTIDLDDYEVASAELVDVDIEAMEEASISSKMMVKVVMAVFTKAMSGYLGNQITKAWLNRDKDEFKRGMNTLIDMSMKYFPKAESAGMEDLELIETARKKKEKSGRGAFLSALMKALSGTVGDQATRGWDSGDPEVLGEALGKAAEKVLSVMPIDETKFGDGEDSSEEDESTEEESTEEETKDEPEMELSKPLDTGEGDTTDFVDDGGGKPIPDVADEKPKEFIAGDSDKTPEANEIAD